MASSTSCLCTSLSFATERALALLPRPPWSFLLYAPQTLTTL